ncbi:MAG: GNAT family N-acetyltransferase [Alicyclobacillaceae bacterium]|nr:GNAT family N-acetyltransferase [Alicyclobacillaceae bacterium]
MARVILRDGLVAELRKVRSTDADFALIQELFENTSPESLYFRFFHAIKSVDETTIRAMIGDDERTLALMCLHEDKAIAIGNYMGTDDGVAEVAFLVRDDSQGRGIGSLLLAHLAEAAWLNGIRVLEAHILRDNYRMLQVFRASGFELTSETDGSSVRLVWALGRHEPSRVLQETRERLATSASLHPFFHPETVAVVGASRDPIALGHLLLRHLLEGEFTGAVYPVHPSARAIAGVRAYPLVSAIPETVDLAVIAVPALGVEEVVEDCLRAKVKAVMILSSGFAEAGPQGLERERMIRDKLRAAGCRLIGPNGLGLVNTSPAVRLNASFAPALPKCGRVGIASHSGALGIAILEYASRVGVGVSSFVSLGNRADVSGNDLLQYWETDAETDIILLYLEAFGNPRKFSRIARRLSRQKPMLAVKSGRSPASLFASHRIGPSLVHDDETFAALFRQAGIIRVDTLQELFDVTALLATPVVASGDRVAVVTNTAGGAVLTADMLTRDRLRLMQPVINLGFEALADSYREVLPAVLRDESVDAVVVLYTPVGPSDESAVVEALGAAIREVREEARIQGKTFAKPVVANFLFTGEYMVRYIKVDDAYRIPIYPFPESAVRALARVVEYHEYRRSPIGRVPDIEGMDGSGARDYVRQILKSHGHAILTESEMNELVRLGGFRMTAVAEHRPAKCTVRLESDLLFGPILRVFPEPSSSFGGPHVVRLLPLTDLDVEQLARVVATWFVHQQPLTMVVGKQPATDATTDYEHVSQELRDFFARLSQLTEDVPEFSGMELALGMDGSQLQWKAPVVVEVGRPSGSEGPVLE